MKLTIKRGETVVNQQRFPLGAVYIGSQAGTNIHLPDVRVARRHAVIFPNEEGVWSFQHLAAGQESRVNDKKLQVHGQTRLNEGDRIAIGDFVIQVDQLGEETPGAGAGRPGEAMPGAPAGPGQQPLPPGSLVKKPTELISLSKARAQQVCQMAAAMQNIDRLPELVSYALDMVLRATGAQRAYIGLRTKPTGPLQMEEGRTRDGRPCDPPKTMVELQNRVLGRGHLILVTQPPEPGTKSAMVVPMLEEKGVYGVLYVDNGPADEEFHTADLDFLSMIACQLMAQRAALATAHQQRKRAVADAERMAAQKVQLMFKPRHVLQWDKLTLTVFHEPGIEPCGDTYDMARLPKGRAALAISSGKGSHTNALLAIPAFKAAFRLSTLHMDAPHLLLQALNMIAFEQRSEPMRISCVFLILDPQSGQMRYAIAGDAAVFAIGVKGELHALEEAKCPAIGVDRRAQFKSASALLPPNCTLVMHTMGVTEAADSEGNTFGLQRFRDCLGDNFDQNPERMVRDLAQDLRDFMGSDKPPQDVTVLVARRD